MKLAEPLTNTEVAVIRFRFKLGPQDGLPRFPPEGKWVGLDEIEASALRKLRNRAEDLWKALRVSPSSATVGGASISRFSKVNRSSNQSK